MLARTEQHLIRCACEQHFIRCACEVFMMSFVRLCENAREPLQVCLLFVLFEAFLGFLLSMTTVRRTAIFNRCCFSPACPLSFLLFSLRLLFSSQGATRQGGSLPLDCCTTHSLSEGRLTSLWVTAPPCGLDVTLASHLIHVALTRGLKVPTSQKVWGVSPLLCCGTLAEQSEEARAVGVTKKPWTKSEEAVP